MKTALLHMVIAIIWLFLSPYRDLPRLFIGLAIGWALLRLFRPLLPEDRYLQGSTAFFKWVWSFCKAMVMSQVRVAQIILFPRRFPINPGFFEYPIDGLSDAEVLILSHSISLTPGTTSVDVDRDREILLIHGLEAGDPDASIEEIRTHLQKPLLAFTRP
jgi:multisubunit Na+/H+ antiporter MnhE subunit